MALRTQVVVHLEPRDAAEFDATAASLGFPTRGAYVNFLHRAMKTAIQLEPLQGQVLRHLGDWGYVNFRQGAPTAEDLARHCFTSESALRKTLEALRRLGLLESDTAAEGPYDGDVRISSSRRYVLTKSGHAAARAVALLEAQRIQHVGAELRR